MDLPKLANEILKKAKEIGWDFYEIRRADTGSVYIELVRQGREWVIIRVADHAQVYFSYIKTYSVSPYELTPGEVLEILCRPLGETGDIFL